LLLELLVGLGVDLLGEVDNGLEINIGLLVLGVFVLSLC
jgi:hypothetical protein